ncbi:MAG: nuclear transport factor 2 family protein [Gemmataceae bacterium]|nr:nuclear transport factor 2 family protein [Gemmataceae bacterium]
MLGRITLGLLIVVAAGAGVSISGYAQQPARASLESDQAAIMKSARDFAEAFNRGDARALAAMWTESGESRDNDGTNFVGRAAIEKSYSELFRARPGAKIEVLVKSVRFPAKDLAIEEGLLRLTAGPKQLPTTTTYVAIHAREGGVWKIALSSESGHGQDRLEDLDWLLGSWSGKSDNAAVKFAFTRDGQKPLIAGTFTRTVTGQTPANGSIRLALDPETGRLRSWGFEDDGAHSQAIWSHDGKNWTIEIRGVLANGTAFSETIVLHRVDADTITWRAIDRVLGGERLPDTRPLRLARQK